MNSKLNKFKSFFYEKIDPWTISKWWHGFAHHNFITNRTTTCIFPFNFVVAILKSFYQVIKSAGYDANEFYAKQKELRQNFKFKNYKSTYDK